MGSIIELMQWFITEILIGSGHPKAKFSAQRDLFAPRDKGQRTRDKVRRQRMREKSKGAMEGEETFVPGRGVE